MSKCWRQYELYVWLNPSRLCHRILAKHVTQLGDLLRWLGCFFCAPQCFHYVSLKYLSVDLHYMVSSISVNKLRWLKQVGDAEKKTQSFTIAVNWKTVLTETMLLAHQCENVVKKIVSVKYSINALSFVGSPCALNECLSGRKAYVIVVSPENLCMHWKMVL